MITYIYLAQTILGIFLWRRFKFSWSDSVLFSLMLLPNIILVSIISTELFMSKLSFVRKKLYGGKEDILEKLEESYKEFIKCTGNNGNGCFIDSCGQNCSCEGLKEFGENLRNNYKPIEDSPQELIISTYWKQSENVITLREALPYDHSENLWNWFTKTYPDLNPKYYDIYKPEKLISPEKR